jgi:restriction system protein
VEGERKPLIRRIEDDEPATWQDLEVQVTRILTESGLHAERGKSLTIARGSVDVDVYAEDSASAPPVVTLFECKHWKRPIPQTVIHAFRSVVADSGANTGIIVSRTGFQAGAENAAQFSNVHLVDWGIFQALFADRWYRNYMMKRGWESLDPLVEYTEPINSRIFRKADSLTQAARAAFNRLREKHALPAIALAPVFVAVPGMPWEIGPPRLPMRSALATLDESRYFPDAILDASSLRGFLNAVVAYADATVAEFDAVFGSRA